MAHIRLDDKRIELSTGKPWIGTGDEAQVRLDAGHEKGTLAIIMTGRQGKAPMLATLEVVTKGVETCLSGERVPGDRAPNPDTAVRFGGAKAIFRSEPEIVDADGETVLLVRKDC